jgi:cation diffusion facilitator family transporter
MERRTDFGKRAGSGKKRGDASFFAPPTLYLRGFILLHFSHEPPMPSIAAGTRAVAVGVVVNAALAAVKIVVGALGSSYALVADGIESTGDIVSSLIVWGGLRIASLPADDSHPYGHGKAESIAGVLAAVGLLVAVQSIHEIRHPHHAPAWYTLPVLVATIVIKITVARRVSGLSRDLASTSLKIDAWHHLSDALTSAAVLVGIAVALYAGPGYEAADDWAALLACLVMVYNGVHLLRGAMREIMDATVPQSTIDAIRRAAAEVDGVEAIEKVRVRKSGIGLFMDIHVEVEGSLTVDAGHTIAHRVKDRLLASGLRIEDVVVHIEPVRDATRA